MSQPPQVGVPLPPQPRTLVNPGLCALISFLWPGAGFFLIPARMTEALILVIGVPIFDFIINFFGALMMGVGLICSIPISIVVHVVVIVWTYKAAVAYNQRV